MYKDFIKHLNRANRISRIHMLTQGARSTPSQIYFTKFRHILNIQLKITQEVRLRTPLKVTQRFKKVHFQTISKVIQY